jgi:nicotinamidase-related amidase
MEVVMSEGRSVLLLMDFQQGIVDGHAEVVAPALVAAGRALTAARQADIPVVFVRVAFRAGFPDVSANNLSFSALKAAGLPMTEDDPQTRIVGELAPLPTEPLVTKRRISAFASDLQVLLSGLQAEHLILAGISTSGVVLSTVRHAADSDYRLTVLSDACADRDDEVHRVLLEKVFPRQAEVITTDEWLSRI